MLKCWMLIGPMYRNLVKAATLAWTYRDGNAGSQIIHWQRAHSFAQGRGTGTRFVGSRLICRHKLSSRLWRQQKHGSLNSYKQSAFLTSKCWPRAHLKVVVKACNSHICKSLPVAPWSFLLRRLGQWAARKECSYVHSLGFESWGKSWTFNLPALAAWVGCSWRRPWMSGSLLLFLPCFRCFQTVICQPRLFLPGITALSTCTWPQSVDTLPRKEFRARR